jgi:uncharacterized membrane protein
MDITANLLFWIHLLSIAFAGAAVFGIPVVTSRLAGAPAESRPVLLGIVRQLSMLGRGALVVLIITGPIIAYVRYGGFSGFGAWFNVKMVLVVLLLIVMIASGLVGRRAQQGDAAAIGTAQMLSIASMVLLVLIILSAVFAFG